MRKIRTVFLLFLLSAMACASDSKSTPDASIDVDDAMQANIDSGLLIDAGNSDANTDCVASDDPCDVLVPQNGMFACIDEGGASGVCRELCVQTIPDTCTIGMCGVNGYCTIDACADFFNNDCPANQRCIPVASDTDHCFSNGAGVADTSCTLHTDCGADLVCAGDVCRAPDCSETQVCGNAGSACVPYNDSYGGYFAGVVAGIGLCGIECDPVLQDCDQLGEVGSGCYISLLTGNATCAPAAAAAVQDDSCSFLNTCSVGYSCVQEDQAGPLCSKLCDSSVSALCDQLGQPGAGYTCVEIAQFNSSTIPASTFEMCVDCSAHGTNPACQAAITSCASQNAVCFVADNQVGFLCLDDGSGLTGECRELCVQSAPDPCLDSFCNASGFCEVSQCSGFFNNDCPGGEQCIPVDSDTDFCFAIGAGADGVVCTDNLDCAFGLACLVGTCQAPDCAPLSGDQTCPANDECAPFTFGGVDSDIGECFTPCTPFVGTECDPTEWCFPASDADEGFCVEDTGEAQADSFCDNLAPATTCAQDLVCQGTTQVCEPLCDRSAVGGEPGLCTVGESCIPFFDAAGELPYGYCEESCDYHGGGGGCTGGEICLMGEVYGSDFDYCIPPPTTVAIGEDCTAAGVAAGELCGAHSACLDDGQTVSCYDLCATSEAAFGTVDHPDCSVPGEACEDIGFGTTLGACL